MAIVDLNSALVPPTGASWRRRRAVSGTASVYGSTAARAAGQGYPRPNVIESPLLGLHPGPPFFGREMVRAAADAWVSGSGFEQGDPTLPAHAVSSAAWGAFAAGTPWPGDNGVAQFVDGPAFFTALQICNRAAGYGVHSGANFDGEIAPLCGVGSPADWFTEPAVTDFTVVAGPSRFEWAIAPVPFLAQPLPSPAPPPAFTGHRLLVAMSLQLSPGSSGDPGGDFTCPVGIFESFVAPGHVPFSVPNQVTDRIGTEPVRCWLRVRWMGPIAAWNPYTSPTVPPSIPGGRLSKFVELP